MSIEKLKAFCKFVEFNNSYGEAAQYSHKSSSAIYKNIKSLEEELGVSLVETLDKRPMLTQRGQVFSQHAKKLIELWDQAVNNISQSCAISGTLNILTTQAIASLWLFDDIADFIKANSNIKIIIKGSDQTNEHWEDYDVLIRPMIEDPLDIFEQFLLTTQQMSLYASDDYIEKYGFPLNRKDLKNHKLIGYADSSGLPYNEINWHLFINGNKVDPFISINTGAGILKAVENGLGIGSISNLGIDISRVKLHRILPEFQGPIVEWYFITKKHNMTHPLVNELYERLKQRYSNQRDYKKIIMAS